MTDDDAFKEQIRARSRDATLRMTERTAEEQARLEERLADVKRRAKEGLLRNDAEGSQPCATKIKTREHVIRLERTIEGQTGMLAALNGTSSFAVLARHYDGFVLTAWGTKPYEEYADGASASFTFSTEDFRVLYQVIGEMLERGTGREH